MERSKPDLKPRRILTIALVLALGVPTLFSLLPGCESTPAEPEYNNPFDPEGPDAGDPLKLTATAQDDATIDLRSWRPASEPGHHQVHPQRRDPTGTTPTGTIGEVGDQTTNAAGSFTYADPDPTRTYWFRAQAFIITDTNEDFSITSYATPDSATTPPLVIIGNGTGTSATRFINLQITVTQGGGCASLSTRTSPNRWWSYRPERPASPST